MRRVLFVLACAVSLLLSTTIALAQTDDAQPEPVEPEPTITATEFVPRYHTVESGETLFFIATFYGVTQEALEIANNISDPTLLFVGQQLLIPAAEGQIVPANYAPQFGETAELIAEKFGAFPQEIVRENYLISPDSLVSGQPIRVFSRTGSDTPGDAPGLPHIVEAGETVFEIAAFYGLNMRAIMDTNGLEEPVLLYPGQRLRIPVTTDEDYHDLPGLWEDVRLDNMPIVQGDTVAVYVEYLEEGTPSGRMTSPSGELTPLRFVPEGDGFVTLVGFDAFSEPGDWSIRVAGEGAARPWEPFEAEFVVNGAGFGIQNIPLDDNRELRATENTFLNAIFIDSNPEPYWTDVFRIPITGSVSAGYGDARSYNNGPIYAFHSGIDFRGSIGTPIYSPAEGIVVYSDFLELRGNAVIIDHGMGVMTAYYHLLSADVEVGDVVEPQQQIAAGGNTGLSTGPHLHWDLRVWGRAVHPTRWLERLFP
ncbi:MAG: LysM peptidoglycan-binding domain-containing M23 family metallopeptidase [Chloroflexota bacterium]